MVIETTRFGEIDVPEEVVLQFPFGLPGFLAEKTFAFLPYVPPGKPSSPAVGTKAGEKAPLDRLVQQAFAFLQSVNNPDLAFLLANPYVFFPDYQAELVAAEVGEIGITPENIGELWTIVSVPPRREEISANLLAPVVINWPQRKAMQIVLEKSPYTTRHRLFPRQAAKAGGAGQPAVGPGE
ncbi:MAG: flagellar assembly protein FliW [Heliobacteriaceae bacterium]|nr:flagellar assembly protein FliW [Heliobacteriaceae bacterium]